jgi:hypothetical protein
MRRKPRTSYGSAVAVATALLVSGGVAYVTGCGPQAPRSARGASGPAKADATKTKAAESAEPDLAPSRDEAAGEASAAAGTASPSSPSTAPATPTRAASPARATARGTYEPRWPSMKFGYGTQAEYYVAVNDPNATDDGPGSEARPFKTLKKACAVARAGDTVAIRAGTYREALMPQHSGEAG